MGVPITGSVQYRILYADTDQMGVVYYGNYGKLYEMGRTELVRNLGFPYAELEKKGVVMPVHSVEAKYRNVLVYDELITIETMVEKTPTARMEFIHRILKEDGSLAHEAKVVLAFLDMNSGRPVRVPKVLLDLFEK